MKKLLYPLAFALSAFLFVYSCSTDEDATPPAELIVKYKIQIETSEGGSVSSVGGEYAKGTTISVTATPNSEFVFTGWSNGSTQNPITIEVNSNLNLKANFEKRKYSLTINIEGEGTVTEEIINTGKTTDYSSGTTVRLTARPSEGWVFRSWGGSVESQENSVDLIVNEAKEINAVFSKIVLASLSLKPKSKMFTKGVADTLLIPINIPEGFKSITVLAEDGSISIESQPEEGDNQGNIIIRYTNQVVNNVDWDRTIAGYDNIDFIIEDLENNSVEIEYKLRTQPEPLFLDANRNFSQFYHGNGYRARLNFELIEHLNRKKNLAFNEDCRGSNEYPYPFFQGFGLDDFEDGKIYLAAQICNDNSEIWRNNFNYGIVYHNPAYVDFNNDGYEDLILTYASIEEDGCRGCIELPYQIYMYNDGEYKFFDFPSLREQKTQMDNSIFLDFDNDGDIDILVSGEADAGGRGEPASKVALLENKLNEINDFEIHDLGGLIVGSVNFAIDLNFDGLPDIINSQVNRIEIYLNKGGYNFEKVQDRYAFFNYLNDELSLDGFNNSQVYFNLDNPVFDDFDGDGILDLSITGDEENWEDEVKNGALPYVPEVPMNKIYFGKIKNYNNESILFFDRENYLPIPIIEGFNRIDKLLFKDINSDGEKEFIAQRLNKNYETGREEGHMIQILKLEGKTLKDITSSIINNFSSNNGFLNDPCSADDEFKSKMRVDDTDMDGNMEIFSMKTMYIVPDGFNHIWEWNGSKFIKVSP